MGDVPPPRLAPLRRPTLITDLPTDVLSYIISLVPGDETWNEDDHGSLPVHVRLSVVCRAFADAVRPPSAVWEDVRIVFQAEDEDSSGSWSDGEDDDDEAEGRGWCEWRNTTPSQQGAYGTLERAMQVAGPCVRRFAFGFYSYEEDVPIRAWIERVLATTPRVHRVDMDIHLVVEGPPPMISAGRGAILDCWIRMAYRPWNPVSREEYLDAVLALHRHLVTAGSQAGSGAARTVVPVLTSMENLDLTCETGHPEMDVQRLLPFIRSFAAGVGQHLTRLYLPYHPRGDSPQGVPTCVDHLPALRELHVGWSDDYDPLDLRGVVTPPRGLTCLVVNSYTDKTVLLPPALMSRLEVMGLSSRDAREPPACLRDAGNSFRRLTRLVYGGLVDGRSADLAGWATPAFAVPTLVVLEVAAHHFTLRASDGPAWAATVASTTLPRLERLALFQDHHEDWEWAFIGSEGSELMDDDEVEEAITHSLPAAAAAAGRSLSVRVQHWNFDLDSISKLVDPHFDADQSYHNVFNLTLKYEARPVR